MVSVEHPPPLPGTTSSAPAPAPGNGLAVLNISLDSQIVRGAAAGQDTLGDPVERQRRYAAHLAALHVVVKTGRDAPAGPVPLAPNAWAYPTRSASRYTFVPDALRIAAGLCRTRRFDVVSAQDPFATGLVAYLISRRFGLRLNVQVHFDVIDDPYWLRERREHRLLNVLGKWLIRRADTVRVGTTRERRKLAGWGIAPERIYVAPVPVDLARFEGAAPDARLRQGLAPGAAVVLNASRLVPQKDLPTFLRAAAQVVAARPGTRFVVAGDGPQHRELEALAGTLGLAESVTLLGRVDRRDMPALYAASDVVVVSSLYEGTSLVTVEAAASAKPVVTTDVAGAADTVVEGISGHVVPVRDPVALAGAVLDVLADPGRAGAMGAAGREHVGRRFALDRAVDDLVALWWETAHPAPASPAGRETEVGTGVGAWVYLANIRVPSEKAHVYQTFQMLDALSGAGVDAELVFPARANLPGIGTADPALLYGLRHTPRTRTLPSLDLVKLITIDRPALNRRPLPALAFGLQSLTFAAAAVAYVRKMAPPAVYSRDWPVLAAVAGAGASVGAGRGGGSRWPLFWEAHDVPQGRLARLALRRLFPHLHGVIPISEGLREELSALGLPPDALLVAPDAVDLERFASPPTRTAARRSLGLPVEARIVVYTGHLYRWKGAHTLALASRHLPPDVTVYVVGGTPADVTAFRAFIAEEALENVRVVGYVPPVEVPVWLAAADALALPNSAVEAISARYTSPLKLFEYMAAGRPIVASDLPSLKEVLADGVNARLVRPDDPVALAAGLTAVLADPAAGAGLAEHATRDVAGRTWHARAAAVRDFVDRRRRRPGAPAPTIGREPTAPPSPPLSPASTPQPAPPDGSGT